MARFRPAAIRKLVLQRITRLAVLASLSLSGCFVRVDPHYSIESPALLFVLTEGSTTLEGVTVKTRRSYRGGHLYETVQTDARGEFRLPEVQRFHLLDVLVIGAHAMHEWSACFNAPGGQLICYRDQDYTPGPPPGEVRIACDLSRLPRPGELPPRIQLGLNELELPVCEGSPRFRP